MIFSVLYPRILCIVWKPFHSYAQPPQTPTTHSSKPSAERIKSSDFRSWDLYDADTEAERVDQEMEGERAAEQLVGSTAVRAELSESGELLCTVEPL